MSLISPPSIQMLASVLASVLALAYATPANAALTANSDGTVTDTSTSLVWDRCSYGLTGVACTSGTAVLANWPTALSTATAANAANYKGFNDWRLPNVKELESIVKIDTSNPAIDSAAFPATPADWFWTSTSYAPDPAGAWFVLFNYGGAFANGTTNSFYVRLVRSGQPLAALDLQAPGPVLSVAGATAASPSTGTLSATSDIAATGYGVVVPQGATAPTAAQVKAGTDAAGVAAPSSSAAMVAGTATTFPTLTGLSGGTAYSVYLVAAGAGPLSTVSGPLNFTTPAASYGISTTASPTAGGSVSCTPNPVNHGSTASCTSTPATGYSFTAFSGDCTGATCSIANVTAAKAVTASFRAVPAARTSYSGSSPTGTGLVTAVMAGSSNAACGFVSTSYKASATGAPGNPPGMSFPHGVFAFTTSDQCKAADGSITFTLTYPAVIPANAKYYKYGPTPDNATPHWYTIAFTGAGTNTLSFTITDGALGDDDLSANGTIVDDGGPAVPVVAAAAVEVSNVANVPTLGEWGLILLVGLMGLLGMGAMRRRGSGT